jgi:hypothetical protein
MTRVDHWGRRAGIVKVIPPKEWIDSLPDIQPEQLQSIKIKSPIQQNMMGIGGLFRQNKFVVFPCSLLPCLLAEAKAWKNELMVPFFVLMCYIVSKRRSLFQSRIG